MSEELQESDAEFEREMDAVSTVYSLRAGHTLTQADYEAIQLYNEVNGRDEQRAINVFHMGYTQGLREGGSADIAQLKEMLSEKSAERAMDKVVRQIAESKLTEIQSELATLRAENALLVEVLGQLLCYEGHMAYCGHGADMDRPCVCGLNDAHDAARNALAQVAG